MPYDITNHKKDLDLLQNVEPNIAYDNAQLFMDQSYNLAVWCGRRSIKPENYEFEILELYQGENIVKVSKQDVEVMAKHFELI